jgi:lipopolysaccharide/colanic/teichoic acid biosynthesis glycosyltransferase
MAQIHGRDGNTLEREIALDTYYIENWSTYLDMKILFQTIGVVFRRKTV